MKLTGKMISSLVLFFVILLVGEAYVTYLQEVALLRGDMDRDGEEFGRGMESLVTRIWQEVGEEKMLELLDQMSKVEGRIGRRWVWLDPTTEERHRPHARLEHLKSLMNEEGSQWKSVDHIFPDGSPVRLTYVEVEVGSGRTGAVELAESMAFRQDAVDLFKRRSLALTGISLLMGGVFVVAMGQQFVGKPLNQLIAKTRRIGRGDLTGPLTLGRWDEFSELAQALNSMCEQLAEADKHVQQETAARITATEQLRHAERLHTVGRLASGIAHELGTPLNVVSGRAGLIISERLSPSEVKESAQIIQGEAERMTNIIRQLLDFARRKNPQKMSVDLRDVITQLLQLLGPLAERGNYSVSVLKQDNAIRSKIDMGQVQQVLTNLIMNAAQSMPEGGDIEIGIRRELTRPPADPQAKASHYVRIHVRDQGQGIPDENLHHIFEPFFTTKEVGKGTGLGLSISYGIVEEHGGWIDVQSQPGSGSCFSVYLPEEVE